VPSQRVWLRVPARRWACRASVTAGFVAIALLAFLAPATAVQADPSLETIERRIAVESDRLERVVEQFNKTTEELKASLASSAVLAKSVEPLAAELATESKRIGELAALAYKGGAFVEISAVLTADDPTVVVDRLTTLNQITKYEQAQIARFTDVKARHDAQATRLNELIADQTAKRKSLIAQRAKINADLAKLYELRRKAYGAAQARAGQAKLAAPPYVAGKAGVAVRYAYGALGKPYVWAADGPGGYDCSGLTLAAWRAAGVYLPHNAAMQWNALPHIRRSSLRPGDLVFYSGLGHVGLYVGNGKIIHAPTFGERVHVASVDVMTPYGYARPG
jgi:peptidoglycan DL-endopeptidase CwlO